MPPLRERRSEISHLTDFFIDRYARRYNRPVRQLSPELQQLFQTYEWPGNIRELENMIKRIVILQDEQLVIRESRRSARQRWRPTRPRASASRVRPVVPGADGRTTSRRTRTSPRHAGGAGGGARGSPTSRRRRRSRPSAR